MERTSSRRTGVRACRCGSEHLSQSGGSGSSLNRIDNNAISAHLERSENDDAPGSAGGLIDILKCDSCHLYLHIEEKDGCIIHYSDIQSAEIRSSLK